MAGGSEAFNKGMPMNSIGFFGLHVMTAGTYYSPEAGGRIRGDSGGMRKKLFSRGGFLTGFVLWAKPSGWVSIPH